MFVGRNEYFDDLLSLWRKSSSSLVACRGRRRIGKSTLIEYFADKTAERFLSFEGLPPRKGMSVCPVLVYDGSLDPQLSGSGYFAATIDASALLRQ